MTTLSDLKKLGITALKVIAKDLGMTGISKYRSPTKDKLAKLIHKEQKKSTKKKSTKKKSTKKKSTKKKSTKKKSTKKSVSCELPNNCEKNNKYKKADIVALAKKCGLDIPSKATRKDICNMISKHLKKKSTKKKSTEKKSTEKKSTKKKSTKKKSTEKKSTKKKSTKKKSTKKSKTELLLMKKKELIDLAKSSGITKTYKLTNKTMLANAIIKSQKKSTKPDEPDEPYEQEEQEKQEKT